MRFDSDDLIYSRVQAARKIFSRPRARGDARRALGAVADCGVDDDARGQSLHTICQRSRDENFRRQPSVRPLQGHRRRKTIGKENGVFIPAAETGIPAAEGKFWFDRAVAISTAAVQKFLREIFLAKTVASAAARILRLIQSQSGCPRRVGAGEIIFLKS